MSEPDDERRAAAKPKPGQAEREARLAAALRANLKRRKAGGKREPEQR